MTNAEISHMLEKIADILEMSMDHPYRVRAYRRAARKISGMQDNIEDLVKQGFDLTQIPYVGNAIAKKINDILLGHMPEITFSSKYQGRYSELREVKF